ncbi:MAG: PaaI family thioesterase [Gammaproteobacteria bacterium]|nr:PaaI family thioesterase [Gammaproteobacteria bacterium]
MSLNPRVVESFNRQSMMTTLGALLVRAEPGVVEIDLPFRSTLSQQHGFIHAGAITSVVDSACGYAALTQAPEGKEVVTVEFKVNFIRPAQGQLFKETGTVINAGRNIAVCSGAVVAWLDTGDTKLVAQMQATMAFV